VEVTDRLLVFVTPGIAFYLPRRVIGLLAEEDRLLDYIATRARLSRFPTARSEG
jgi:hypothetical protein